MNKHNRFRRGSGCFTCDGCGRLTRDTGQGSVDICELCYELGGIDNTINDNGLEGEEAAKYRAEANGLLKEIVKRGGDEARAKRGLTYIWPATSPGFCVNTLPGIKHP